MCIVYTLRSGTGYIGHDVLRTWGQILPELPPRTASYPPRPRRLSQSTRHSLVMQSTGLCDIRVRVACISSSMERKIQFLIRITNITR